MPRGSSWPDYSKGETWDQQSARQQQTVANAAKRADEASVGHGLTRRGATPSVVPQPKVAIPRTIKIVAVVGKPNLVFHKLIVREVAYASEGADYEPPDSPPEDPPPIEPVPAILRWKGEPFYALPGYARSVAEFASTWFSDVLRDDAGEPILEGGEPIEQLPDDTIIVHYAHLRPEGSPVLFEMGGGGVGAIVQQFRIITLLDDSLICKKWDGEQEGVEARVWKPWSLRVSALEYTNFLGETFEGTGSQKRTKTLPSGAFEEQVTNKLYHGEPDGDILYAVFQPLGGIASHHPRDHYANIANASWLDTNYDGRAWAKVSGS